MFRGLYSAATAMDIATRSHEITSQNLAHSTAPGFRARGLVFQTFERALEQAGRADAPPLSGSGIDHGYTDFRPGAMQPTGAPLDLALSGDGFFALQGPDGPVYTRNGAFHTEADGRLVSSSGLPVLGVGGPIIVPRQAADVKVERDGSVTADGGNVGRLQITRFANPGALEPAGATHFRPGEDAAPSPSLATVMQGMREQSNVQLAGAMMSLVRDMRYFEASHQALKTLSDATGLLTRPS